MAKPIWFPFYTNDFLASTKVAVMSTEEVGAYLFLLCHAWQDPTCSLPVDDLLLHRIARFDGDLSNIRACFVVKRGRLVNERLYDEWIKAYEYKRICSDAGRNGADRRWPQRVTPPVTGGDTGTQHRKTHSSPSPSQSPSEKIKKEKETRTRMPENWTVSEAGTVYAKKKGMTAETIQHEFEHCKERHASALFVDWSAVWRAWCLNWVSFGAKQIVAPATSTHPFAGNVPKGFRLYVSEADRERGLSGNVEALIGKVGKGMPS